MHTTTPLTCAEIRALLDDIEANDAADLRETEHLTAEIITMARWLTPHPVWKRIATHITDEPGHWDTTYPPKAHVAERTAHRYIISRTAETRETPTSNGYYHTYELVTDRPGLAIDAVGTISSIVEYGSAALGQYAAHPGECHRDIHRDIRINAHPSLDDLRALHKHLTELVIAEKTRAA